MFELIDKVTFCNCKQSTIIDYTFKLMKLWSSLVKWYKLLKQQELKKNWGSDYNETNDKKTKGTFSDKINISNISKRIGQICSKLFNSHVWAYRYGYLLFL